MKNLLISLLLASLVTACGNQTQKINDSKSATQNHKQSAINDSEHTNSDSANNSDTNTQTDGASITIGAILPFSGGQEILGEQAKAGIDLAVKEINAAGGIKGHTITVAYEDSENNAQLAVDKVTNLINDKAAVAIIGSINASVREAITPKLGELKTPLLYASNYQGGICSDYVYSFNIVPNQAVDGLIAETTSTVAKSFYLLAGNKQYNEKTLTHTQQQIKQAEGTVVGTDFIKDGAEDFSAVINKIKATDAKLLVLSLTAADTAKFILQAREQDLHNKLSFIALGFSESYVNELGNTDGLDLWTALPFVSTMDKNSNFVDAITENNAFIAGVSQSAYSHYNAIKALAKSLENKDNISSEALTAGLKNLSTETFTLNSENQADLEMYIAKLKDGELQMVKKLGKQDAKTVCAK